jgi:glycosyltransferase involved in cell wall biosynthesis
MGAITLSLCIPTYNRALYLRELLPNLIAEVGTANQSAMRVELLISNNASTDETDSYLGTLSCRGLRVYRNAENIGADRNFLACIERASGEYVWLFGDDEVIVPGGIARIMKLLSKEQPFLVILRDGKNVLDVSEEVIYPNYCICVREEMKRDEGFGLTHTLITANLFRKDIFDLKAAAAKLYTNYAHMYGLLDGLKRGGGVVMMTGIFRSREQRAQFDRWPTALCIKQAGYLWRLAGAFGVPRLRRIAFRLALNLPIEVLSRCLHMILPNRFGRT